MSLMFVLAFEFSRLISEYTDDCLQSSFFLRYSAREKHVNMVRMTLISLEAV